MNSEDFIKDIFLSGDLSDVRVIVENKMGQKWSFPAHSFVLKRTSSVLAKMLESDFAEGQSKTITITDFKASHVKQFFKFLYTGTLPETYASLCKLTKLAHKYMVQRLLDKCEEALMGFLNLQNIYELCNFAELYSLEKLRGSCLSLMKRAAFKLLKLDELECLSEEFLKDVVSADDLNISSEMEVFWAIWKWGRLRVGYQEMEPSNENIREIIKDLLKHVRLSVMDKDHEEKMANLGIKVENCDLQDELQARTPTVVSPTLFLNQCNVLNLTAFASLKYNNKEVPLSNCFLRLVSFAEIPFYVVGLVFVGTDYYIGGKLICKCESAFSTANIETTHSKCFKIANVNYYEVLCEFPKPVEICKNQTLTISKPTSYCPHERNVIRDDKGRSLCIEGTVQYGITKLFLL